MDKKPPSAAELAAITEYFEYDPKMRAAIQAEIDELVEAGVIEPWADGYRMVDRP